MTVAHTWPLATDPLHLTRLDNDDAALNTWVIAWVARTLPRDPLHLFEAPIFYPEARTLAYSEHLLVPSLLGAPLLWAGAPPVLVHNLLIMAGLALSGWAMYLLMFRWTGHASAAAISGLLYAFNAHTLTRFVHVQAFHIWMFPAMLYAFDRILIRSESDGFSRRWTHVALLAAAFSLQALSSNYLLVFSAMALAVAAVVRADEWVVRSEARNRLIAAGIASLLVLAPFLYPYYALSQTNALPAHSHAEITHYSATWRDYLATGGRLHYSWWSAEFFGDIALFPGITALALSAAAIARGGLRDARVRMVLAIGVVGLALSFGTHLPGYWWLHQHVPLVGALRNVGRWGFLPLAAVSMLAGFGARGSRSLAIAAVILVTVEACRAPIGLTHYEGIPRFYERLADQDVVVAEFPFFAGQAWSQNGRYLLNNTRYFKPLINGYSSYWPPAWEPRARILETFPSAEAIDELRRLGATDVVVHVDAFEQRHGAPALAAVSTVPGLTLAVEENGIRLYRLPSTR